MKFSFNLRNGVAILYNKVWHAPKGKLSERLKRRCEELTQKQRLTVVTVMLSLFIVIAFGLFGRACYRMGAGEAEKKIEIRHIQQLDVTKKSPEVMPSMSSDYSPNPDDDEVAR